MECRTIFSVQEEFAKISRPVTSLLPLLHDISLVGAYKAAGGLAGETDMLCLEMTLKILNDCNIPVARDFNLDIVNIDPDHGGRNFLTETKPADLVIMCSLLDPGSSDHYSIQKTRAQRSSSPSVSIILKTMPGTEAPPVWAQKLSASLGTLEKGNSAPSVSNRAATPARLSIMNTLPQSTATPCIRIS